jgi:hypothetical protein
MAPAKGNLRDLVDAGDTLGITAVYSPAELPLVGCTPAPDGSIGVPNARVTATDHELIDDRISVQLGRGEIFRRRPIASKKRDHRARERSNP